jgi:hypothetical protein
MFGMVDHLWNGELFLIGQAPLSDLLLGVTITGAVFTSWGITLGIARRYPDLSRRMGYRMGILRSSEKR